MMESDSAVREDPPRPADADPVVEELAEVGHYPTAAKAHEHGLVILAMQQSYWVLESNDGFKLLTETPLSNEILAEIEAYEAEQSVPTVRDSGDERFHYPAGGAVIVLWMLVVTASFRVQLSHPAWQSLAASSNIGLIRDHQWWRPFTALFLHADVPHLVGNLLAGAFFAALVARSIGAVRAWLLILACGTLGNTLTALTTWPDPFTSMGASTAVFGALGILSGLGFSSLLRHRKRLPLARLTAPLIGGLVLLGLMGGATPPSNTDVLGHVFGFCCGTLAGFTAARLTRATAGASTAGTSTAAHDARL